MANFALTEASGRLKALYGDLQTPLASLVLDKMEAFERENITKNIFAERKSENWAQTYGTITNIDSWAPVGENGAHPQGGFQEGYRKTLENVTWKGGVSISRELLDDNKIADILKRPDMLVRDYERKYELFHAAILASALKGLTGYTLGGFNFSTTSSDDVCLFSKSHKPKVTGPNQSNVFAGDFTVEVLDFIVAAMQNVLDDDGNVLSLCPDTIIIPNLPTLKRKVIQAIGSDKDPNTANNAINTQYGNWKLIVNPYLNQFITPGTSPFIIQDSNYNEAADGAIRQTRIEPEISDELGSNDEYIIKGYARFTAGFGDFRAMFAGGVAGGTAVT